MSLQNKIRGVNIMSEALLKVKLVACTPDPEAVVALGAKMCYSNAGNDNLMQKLSPEEVDRFVGMLVNIGHESPIEHVSFTFVVEGVSRVLTHQLVRHRIASYSQKSQRYVNEGQFEYIVPGPIKDIPAARKVYIEAMESAQDYYNTLYDILYPTLTDKALDTYAEAQNIHRTDIPLPEFNAMANACKKKAGENARYVLPNACETKIMLTMNARSLKHFFNERCCERAQDEIRAMAVLMLKECKKVAPVLFKNAGPKCMALGHCPEGKMSCGKFEEKRLYFGWQINQE
jgi:thymidylate synthase (FAD)